MSTVLRNPAEMIAHGAPRVIHNDEELEVYTAALVELTVLVYFSPQYRDMRNLRQYPVVCSAAWQKIRVRFGRDDNLLVVTVSSRGVQAPRAAAS